LERAKIHANQNEAIILLSLADDHPLLVGSSNKVHDTSAMLPKGKKFTDWLTEQGGLTGQSVYARWKRGAQKYSANLSKDYLEDGRSRLKKIFGRLRRNSRAV
jgi:hypothetical protein